MNSNFSGDFLISHNQTQSSVNCLRVVGTLTRGALNTYIYIYIFIYNQTQLQKEKLTPHEDPVVDFSIKARSDY